MKRVSSRQMERIDAIAQKRWGIPRLILMENAGRSVADAAQKLLRAGARVEVICGKGYNGGDGIVAARHLFNRGFRARVVLIGRLSEAKEEVRFFWNMLKPLGIPHETASSHLKLSALRPRLLRANLVVDALLGTGLTQEVREPVRSAIELLNSLKRPVLSIDLPSGLSADDGRMLGACVRARETVTLCLPKTGLFRGEGPRHAGRITVGEIGVPGRLCENLASG